MFQIREQYLTLSLYHECKLFIYRDKYDIGFSCLILTHLVILYDYLIGFANDATLSNTTFTLNYYQYYYHFLYLMLIFPNFANK